MNKVVGFDNKPVIFEYNMKIYHLYERDDGDSCKICCFNKPDDFGLSCNDAKSESISCYAACGKRFWVGD